MAGTVHSAEIFGEIWRIHVNSLRFRIHSPGVGSEHEIGPALAAEYKIAGKRARIPFVIVSSVELQRVNENTDGDPAAFRSRAIDQCAVPLMKRSHRGDKSDA